MMVAQQYIIIAKFDIALQFFLLPCYINLPGIHTSCKHADYYSDNLDLQKFSYPDIKIARVCSIMSADRRASRMQVALLLSLTTFIPVYMSACLYVCLSAISPGCPRPSIAVTVQNCGLKHQSFILSLCLSIHLFGSLALLVYAQPKHLCPFYREF